jgi:hypothetical protein
MINFSDNQTTLDLNGPILTHIVGIQTVSVIAGSAASFTGIATATFPSSTPKRFATNTGIITYRWYDQNGPLFDDPYDDDGEGVTISGAGTTILTLYNNNYSKRIYLRADYSPSAYGLPGVPITAGTARSTGNAIDDPKDSNVASLNIIPKLFVSSEPLDNTVSLNTNSTFTSTGILFNNTIAGIQYQWQLNGVDIADGTFVVNSPTIGSNGTLEITDDVDGTVINVNFDEISSYSKFIPGRSYTIVSTTNISTKLTALGAGGGSSVDRIVDGGKGGLSTGIFTFIAGNNYKLVVGGAGNLGDGGGYGGGGDGGGGSGYGGGGGGYTGLFLTSITQSNSIIIAGGGGGGANDPALGGDGGGTVGSNAANFTTRGGTGGTQSSGGSGSQNGSALSGGSGSAGGGGGYFGGGGGVPYNFCCADGAGGGGSGYIHPTLLTNSSTVQGQGALPGYDGSFIIECNYPTSSSVSITASGTKTPTLTISSSGGGLNNVRCKITHPTAVYSPRYSRLANFTAVNPRNILHTEQYFASSSTSSLSSINLSNVSSYTFTPSNTTGLLCLYAPEKDINIEIELYGSKGIDIGSFKGGLGGYSKIRFTMLRNTEYIIFGINSNTAPFLYRKSSLIASVGSGGNASSSGDGGGGGGIGISGLSGSGSNAGSGGQVVPNGTLPLNGIFGSLTTEDPIFSGDIKASNPFGGRALPCPRGVYWQSIGKNPCDGLGVDQFYLYDGTIVINSDKIDRGYKSGYGITQTAGVGINGGNGGDGVTGGNGGYNGAGGGGGSGYTDGSVSVVESVSSFNNGPTKLVIRLQT